MIRVKYPCKASRPIFILLRFPRFTHAFLSGCIEYRHNWILWLSGSVTYWILFLLYPVSNLVMHPSLILWHIGCCDSFVCVLGSHKILYSCWHLTCPSPSPEENRRETLSIPFMIRVRRWLNTDWSCSLEISIQALLVFVITLGPNVTTSNMSQNEIRLCYQIWH